MEQRVSVITLGVGDLAAARSFYEALGWSTNAGPDDDVVFFQAGGLVLALWDRAKLAADSGVEDAGGYGGVTLAHNVGSPDEVDAVMAQAEDAGATVTRPAGATFWGGYSGAFADPAGHPWEIAHNPRWTIAADGSIHIQLVEVPDQPEIALVEGGAELLDAIEPLWISMFDHHAAVAREPAAVAAIREARDGWARRRRDFERSLGAGEAFILLARRAGSAVGFALVRFRGGEVTFDTGDRVAELESLSVLPELRGRGIGSRLLDEVHRRLAEERIGFISLSVVAGNEDALRFYRRWGMKTSHVRCLGPVKSER